MHVENYLFPTSVDECLARLTEYNGTALIIAGGTDLMPKLAQKEIEVGALIDVTGIEGLSGLQVADAGLTIGAGVTHATVAGNKTVRQIWPALAKACGSIGSPQIRNVATLSGNIVTALPGADSAVALSALGATVEIATPGKKRLAAIEDLYAGVGRSKVDSRHELITAIHVPRPRKQHGNAFGRISPRNSFCFPIVNAAAALICEKHKIVSARLAVGPAADRPFHPKTAEAVLTGAMLGDEKAVAEAALLASREANPRSSCLRGCSDYRRELLKVLVRQVVQEAAKSVTG